MPCCCDSHIGVYSEQHVQVMVVNYETLQKGAGVEA
jgi:hypothetical protein